jgi:hypothetical protein
MARQKYESIRAQCKAKVVDIDSHISMVQLALRVEGPIFESDKIWALALHLALTAIAAIMILTRWFTDGS